MCTTFAGFEVRIACTLCTLKIPRAFCVWRTWWSYLKQELNLQHPHGIQQFIPLRSLHRNLHWGISASIHMNGIKILGYFQLPQVVTEPRSPAPLDVVQHTELLWWHQGQWLRGYLLKKKKKKTQTNKDLNLPPVSQWCKKQKKKKTKISDNHISESVKIIWCFPLFQALNSGA